MIKKILAGVVLAAVFGFVVFGAVNHVQAKAPASAENARVDEGGGRGYGYTQTERNQVLNEGECALECDGLRSGAGFGPGDCTGNPEPPLDGSGYGYGAVNQQAGFGAGWGARPEDAPRDGTHSGIAQVSPEDWVTTQGVVESISSAELKITLEDGTTISIVGRALSFLAAQGFTLNPGDVVSLTGFYVDDFFQIGQVENLTTSASLSVRADDGRPLWAGGGQRGGRK